MRRRPTAAALLIVCAQITVPASALAGVETNQSVPLETAQLTKKSRELANLLSPPGEAERNFVANQIAAYDDLFARDKTILDLEARKPGVTQAVRAKILSKIEELASVEVDRNIDAISKIYEGSLTESELDAAIAFYTTPLGNRIIRKMIAAAMATYQSGGKNAFSQNPENAVNDMTQKAALAAFDAIQPQEVRVVAKFMKSSAYLKMQLAGPEIQKTVTQTLLASQERVAAQLMPVITQGVREYLIK